MPSTRGPLARLLILGLLPVSSCVRPDPMAPARAAIAHFEERHSDNALEHTVGARTLRVYHALRRERPLLLFIHGSPGSALGWAEYLQHPGLAQQFDVLAVDRLGYGGSARGGAEPSLRAHARSLASFLAANFPNQSAIVVGHSFGAPVAAALALEAPRAVRGVVFVAGSLDPELEVVRWYQHLAFRAPVRWVLPAAIRVCNDEIYTLAAELRLLRDELARWQHPVAIVHGTADALVPVENVDFIERRISAAHVVHRRLLEGRGHFLPWHHSEAIIEAIGQIARTTP